MLFLSFILIVSCHRAITSNSAFLLPTYSKSTVEYLSDCGDNHFNYRIRQSKTEKIEIDRIRIHHEKTDSSWDTFFQDIFGHFHWDAAILSQRNNLQIVSVPIFHDTKKAVKGIMRIHFESGNLIYNFLDKGINKYLLRSDSNNQVLLIQYLFEMFEYSFCQTDTFPQDLRLVNILPENLVHCKLIEEKYKIQYWQHCQNLEAMDTELCNQWLKKDQITTYWIECPEI